MTVGRTVTVSTSQVVIDIRREAAGYAVMTIVTLGVLLSVVIEVCRLDWRLHVPALTLMIMPLAAWPLLGHRYAMGARLLVLACLVAGGLVVYWLPSSSNSALVVLSVVLAALLLDTADGLAVFLLASGIVLLIPIVLGAAEMGQALPLLLLLWAVDAITRIFTRSSFVTANALWEHYEQAHELLGEARQQRQELKQAQEDLLQANTELARLTDRLVLMRQLAEEARRIKEEFVANVSHELRTPLNMIIGFSEMISLSPETYGPSLPAALLADIGVILRNSRHLAGLVDDVLDLSQVDAGRLSLTREAVSLEEIIHEAAVAVRPLYEAKRLDLRINVQPNLPLLYCDRTRVRQVLLNLLSNAGRFTERGGCTVSAERDEAQIVVSVADTGPGIAPEQQGRVFEPFQQADGSIRRRYGGTGLGLSISKRFVEMHDGRMWLESLPGQGSTFRFSLPTHTALLPLAAGPSRWLSEEYAERPRRSATLAPVPSLIPRLMVVEPGNVLRRLLARYLSEFEVGTARTVDEAITQLAHSPAQALLINDSSPDRVAQQLASRADELPMGIPAITCWVPGEADAATHLGVAQYLLKPVSREALLAALDGLGRPIRAVLVVDDQDDALQLFGRMLKASGRGYNVLRAPNGRWALDLMHQRHPDVVLLDLVMPVMDGYAVLRQMNAAPDLRDIPVIAISALDPVHASITSRSLTLVRSGGLTFRDLLSAVCQWAEVPRRQEPDLQAAEGTAPG
jgi:signal transduction histidine kinase/DNA-binding response OmpR family regulator